MSQAISKKKRSPVFQEQDLQTQELREKGILFGVGIVIPLFILILWELTTRQGWVDELFLPSLSGIVTEFLAMANKGYAGTPLIVHVLGSLRRVFIAFSIGTVVGLLLGLLMGYYKYVRAAFY
ncbi:MAG: ABC transporter permease, partial [Leptolyngbya sp. SIO1D8]|nr:ABC transporter permease [Leptolyngbya sp. SIO1D8]